MRIRLCDLHIGDVFSLTDSGLRLRAIRYEDGQLISRYKYSGRRRRKGWRWTYYGAEHTIGARSRQFVELIKRKA
jgi:hypothetical protein